MEVSENTIRYRILGLDGTGPKLDRYEFVKEEIGGAPTVLGTGGSGVVVLGHQQMLPGATMKRAVKFFLYQDDLVTKHDEEGEGRISTQNFLDEVSVLSSLNHQRILKVVECNLYKSEHQEVKIPYLVTDYVAGSTLKQAMSDGLLRSYVSEKPEIIIDIITGIFEGLQYIHSLEYFHYDIAPKNIFITLGREVVIGDLGLGRSRENARRNGDQKVPLIGSKSWCPPWVAEHMGELISLSDMLELQPYWDIYSSCHTGIALLNHCEEVIPVGGSMEAWVKALRATLESGRKKESGLDAESILDTLRDIHPVNHTLWGVHELSRSDTNRVLLPIESVAMTDRVEHITKHPALLRLKDVPQLMLISRTFPSGGHTRYEHTLGTYENCRKLLVALTRDPEFLRMMSPSQIETTIVSTLLDNVTRYPLAIAVQEIRNRQPGILPELSKGAVFEEIERRFNEPLREVVSSLFPRAVWSDVVALVVGEERDRLSIQAGLASAILNGSLDIRVLDYLRRDAYHLGVSSAGLYDIEYLLENMRLKDGRLVIKSSAISTAEQVLAQRYWLHERIYWNRLNRSVFAMLRYALLRIRNIDNVDKRIRDVAIEGNEEMVLSCIADIAEEVGFIDVSVLANALTAMRPRLYKEVVQYNRFLGDSISDVLCRKFERMAPEEELRVVDKLQEMMVGEFSLPEDRIHCLVDIPTESGREKFGSDINVWLYQSEIRSLVTVSSVVSGIQAGVEKRIQRLRVYMMPETYDKLNEDGTLERAKSEIRLVMSYYA